MEEKKPVSHFVAGLIIAASLVVYSLILNFTGQSQNQTLGWIAYIILIGGLVYFINAYAKAKDNHVTFGQLFTYGFKATAIITLVMIVFIIIFFMAFPEYKEKIIETSREAMEKQGKMSDDQIDQALEIVNRNFLLFTAGSALFMYLIIGAIGSLLGAAVTRKRPKNPFEQ